MLPHSSALRRGRCSLPGHGYVVTTVTRNRAPLFVDFHAARLAICELQRSDELAHCRTLAFVLMPDHLHWLLWLAETSLPDLLGAFKANSAKAINRYRSTPGVKLWQSGFHDHTLRAEEDVVAAARYLIANPVRAGLVCRCGDYPHWDAAWF
jgi:putative transposase